MVASVQISETSERDAGAVIDIENLSRRFGQKQALDNVSLRVAPGTVLGLVGENGAGKTTLIKHVLGLLRAETGSVRIFGLDPVTEPVSVLRRLGYLSEENDLPNWMRVHELLRYVSAFYPTWDARYADQLVKEFELDLNGKIKTLSKGQKARAGLVAALAYRPELLVLDEPSSGLDPVVRRDILGAIIRTIADEGRTVLFSSHLLSEVERVSDQVAMIRAGKILFCDSVEEIRRAHARITVHFTAPRLAAPKIPQALVWEGAGSEWTAWCAGAPEELRDAIHLIGGAIVSESSPTLDEIFLARVGKRRTEMMQPAI